MSPLETLMLLIFVIAFCFALAWLFRWADRRDMKAAIRETEAIDWMRDAYNLECEETQKLVTVRTFKKVEAQTAAT